MYLCYVYIVYLWYLFMVYLWYLFMVYLWHIYGMVYLWHIIYTIICGIDTIIRIHGIYSIHGIGLGFIYRVPIWYLLFTWYGTFTLYNLFYFFSQMKPQLMRGLLRKLVDDLPTLEDFTLVPLKMMTLWYDRCGKYYSSHSSGGPQASEEEKKLTMTLFTKIFDALAQRVKTYFWNQSRDAQLLLK